MKNNDSSWNINNDDVNKKRLFYPTFSESEEEKKSLVEQNTPYFAIRLTDTEVMENTYLRFMIKVLGEPRPKIQL